MLTMWFAKDGARPNSQSGPGISITAEEARVIVGLHRAIYLGNEAPSINRNKPSYSLKNVVLEVESGSEVASLLSEAGFYVVADLAPEDARRALDAHRKQVKNRL